MAELGQEEGLATKTGARGGRRETVCIWSVVVVTELSWTVKMHKTVRLTGEVSIASDRQVTPPLRQKGKN